MVIKSWMNIFGSVSLFEGSFNPIMRHIEGFCFPNNLIQFWDQIYIKIHLVHLTKSDVQFPQTAIKEGSKLYATILENEKVNSVSLIFCSTAISFGIANAFDSGIHWTNEWELKREFWKVTRNPIPFDASIEIKFFNPLIRFIFCNYRVRKFFSFKVSIASLVFVNEFFGY
jgi:hypothetical protein